MLRKLESQLGPRHVCGRRPSPRTNSVVLRNLPTQECWREIYHGPCDCTHSIFVRLTYSSGLAVSRGVVAVISNDTSPQVTSALCDWRRHHVESVFGDRLTMTGERNPRADCEYIVVVSGAGGGTVAARLAEAGHDVILLEAGGDPRVLQAPDANNPDANTLPEDYDVPVFHALSTENAAMKWDFFVRHFADTAQQRKDCKFVEAEDGVLYPRAGTLGGCTAHNAMIMVYPRNEDWDAIAALTGDNSWSAENMRGHFERLENCHHRPIERDLAAVTGVNPSKHGWHGWLQTEKAIPKEALGCKSLVETLIESAHHAFEDIGHPLQQCEDLLECQLDPNDWRVVKENPQGLRYTPLMTRGHQD